MIEDRSPAAARSEPSLSRMMGVVMRVPRKAAPSSPSKQRQQANLKDMKLSLSHCSYPGTPSQYRFAQLPTALENRPG